MGKIKLMYLWQLLQLSVLLLTVLFWHAVEMLTFIINCSNPWCDPLLPILFTVTTVANKYPSFLPAVWHQANSKGSETAAIWHDSNQGKCFLVLPCTNSMKFYLYHRHQPIFRSELALLVFPCKRTLVTHWSSRLATIYMILVRAQGFVFNIAGRSLIKPEKG